MGVTPVSSMLHADRRRLSARELPASVFINNEFFQLTIAARGLRLHRAHIRMSDLDIII